MDHRVDQSFVQVEQIGVEMHSHLEASGWSSEEEQRPRPGSGWSSDEDKPASGYGHHRGWSSQDKGKPPMHPIDEGTAPERPPSWSVPEDDQAPQQQHTGWSFEDEEEQKAGHHTGWSMSDMGRGEHHTAWSMAEEGEPTDVAGWNGGSGNPPSHNGWPVADERAPACPHGREQWRSNEQDRPEAQSMGSPIGQKQRSEYMSPAPRDSRPAAWEYEGQRAKPSASHKQLLSPQGREPQEQPEHSGWSFEAASNPGMGRQDFTPGRQDMLLSENGAGLMRGGEERVRGGERSAGLLSCIFGLGCLKGSSSKRRT